MLSLPTALLVRSKNSCGFTFVVFQDAPKPFATSNRAFMGCVLADRRQEQHVALAVMIALVMIMRHVSIVEDALRRPRNPAQVPADLESAGEAAREALGACGGHPGTPRGLGLWVSPRCRLCQAPSAAGARWAPAFLASSLGRVYASPHPCRSLRPAHATPLHSERQPLH